MFCSFNVFAFYILFTKGSSSDVLYVTVGSTAIFACPFRSTNYETIWRGPPKLSFLSKNNDVSTYSTRSKRIKITGNFTAGEYNLELKNFTKSDEGFYICDTIENGKGLQHKRFASLATKPSTIGNQRDFIFQTHVKEEVNVVIRVESFEEPVVTWSDMAAEGKRGVWTINKLNGMNYEVASVIIPENERQFGIYRLRIRNSAGSIDTSVDIVSTSVLVSPRQSSCEMTKTVNLTCVLDKNHFDLTFSNVWLHEFNGVIIRKLSGRTIGNISSLSVTFCVYKDGGNYTCKWSSASEEFSAIASVTVQSRPIFIKKDVSIANDLVFLEVIFVSTPKPDNVSWYQNLYVINKNEYVSKLDVVTTVLPFYGKNVSTSGLSSTLELQQKHVNYSFGSYSCIIKNTFGYIDVTFDEKDIITTTNRTNEDFSKKQNDVLKTISVSAYTACSAVIILLLIGIIGIMKNRKRKRKERISPSNINEQEQYYHEAESENQNDVIEFQPQTYEYALESDYEEIENVSNCTEEEDHHRPTYQNIDEDEVPMVYEELQNSFQEIHTYLKCNENHEEQ